MAAHRLAQNPIIHPRLDARIGSKINGPALIGGPDWVRNPQERYYLYFAHHEGAFIRMAYADQPMGPYTANSPGVLPVERTRFKSHIASPDVHVDHEAKKIEMYYHGFGYIEKKTLP